MKQQIQKLQADIGGLMQYHLSIGNFETVTILSALLSRIQDLQKRDAEIRREVEEIESTLTTLKADKTTPASKKVAALVPQLTASLESQGSERGRPQTLKIKIDWKANKRSRNLEEICENTAASSMTHFLSRVIEEFGNDALQKMEQIRINRGPLLSKNPSKDFANKMQGKLYGHKKIQGTDYYVLTHSATSEKVEDLKNICRAIGFVPGSVQIEQVNRHSWLDGLN